MKALVLGYGSIGKRHVRNLQAIDPGIEIWVSDPLLDSGAISVEAPLKTISGKGTPIDRVQDFNFVLVCGPSAIHKFHWVSSSKLNVPVFVEKPVCLPSQLAYLPSSISPSLLVVGHNLLWHPIVQTLRELIIKHGPPLYYLGRFGHHLPYWRGDVDSYSRHADQGGGVSLDCIQDLDLCLELMGNEPDNVMVLDEKLSTVTVDSDDFSTIHMDFGSSSAVLVTDYLRQERLREIEVCWPNVTAVWRSEYVKSAKVHMDRFKVIERGKVVDRQQWDSDSFMDKTYVDELRAFVNWVKTGERPQIVPDPFRALRVLERGRYLATPRKTKAKNSK